MQKAISVKYENQEIAIGLKEAREAKQLSQRDLSLLTGIPQAQISRIEVNAVDLRLSSLIALANALDLEITLIPRKASPAIRSITRQMAQNIGAQSSTISKEIDLLQKAIRTKQIVALADPQLEEMRRAVMSLQRTPLGSQFLAGLRSVRSAIEAARFEEAVAELKTLLTQSANSPPPAEQNAGPRPAYVLDEEDYDA